MSKDRACDDIKKDHSAVARGIWPCISWYQRMTILRCMRYAALTLPRCKVIFINT